MAPKRKFNKLLGWDKQEDGEPKPDGYYARVTNQGGNLIRNNTDGSLRFELLNGIIAGDGYADRHGNTIKCKSLRIWGILEYQTAPLVTLIEGNVCRIAVVWDKSPNGVMPDFDDIFGLGPQSGEFAGILMPVRPDRSDRYELLLDKRITNNSFLGTALTGIQYVHYDETIDMEGRMTQYSQSFPFLNDDITAISTGALILIIRSKRALTTNGYFLDGRSSAALTFYGHG